MSDQSFFPFLDDISSVRQHFPSIEFTTGKMNFCHEVLKPDAIFDPAIISNKSQCLAQNMTWSQPFWNFDNVGMSYVYLFGVVSLFYRFYLFICHFQLLCAVGI